MGTARQESRDAIEAAYDKHMSAYGIELAKIHLSAYPTDGLVWFFNACMLYPLSRYEEAKNAFDLAWQFSPEYFHEIICSERGDMCQRQGEFAEAEKWRKKAIELGPTDARWYVEYGNLAFRRGDLEQTERIYRDGLAACEEGSDWTDVLFANLGGVLVVRELYEEAEACYLKALDMDPDYKFAKTRLRTMRRAMAVQKRRFRQLVSNS